MPARIRTPERVDVKQAGRAKLLAAFRAGRDHRGEADADDEGADGGWKKVRGRRAWARPREDLGIDRRSRSRGSSGESTDSLDRAADEARRAARRGAAPYSEGDAPPRRRRRAKSGPIAGGVAGAAR